MKTLALGLALAACLPTSKSQDSVAEGVEAPAPAAYGFAGRELYKFSSATYDLAPADLNGDGLGDLVFVDPRRSRIELLERLPADAPDTRDASLRTDKPNQAEYDGRFKITHHPVERRVLKLAAGDWNADSRTDVAWVTQGGQLTVRWSTEDSQGRLEQRVVDELREGCRLLETADFDADGVPDLLACGSSKLVLFAGPAAGTPASTAVLAGGRVVDIVEPGVDRIDLRDLDGDGTADLLYSFLSKDFPFRYRLGEPGGSFGPRIDVDLPQVRSALVRDLDGDGACEVTVVFRLSGRLSVLSLADLTAGKRALRRYALAPSEDRQPRGFAIGDLDGDGLAEVVVTQPQTSEVVVFSGARGSRRLRSAEYPSLVGVAHPRIGDVDGDGRPELVVMSRAERMLGVARPAAEGVLAFPRTVPLDAQPCALEVADMTGDGVDDAVLISVKGEGRSREFQVEVWTGGPAGLGGPSVHLIEGLKKEPSALRAHDLDRDGRLDLIAFMPGERAVPRLLFQRDEGFRSDARGDDTPGLGVLAGAGPRNVSFGDVNGDGHEELLAASANFARALTLEADAEGRTTPAVMAQFSGPAPDSKIEACVLADLAVLADLPGDAGTTRPELVLRDARTKELLVFGFRPSALPGGPGRLGPLHSRVAAGRLKFAGLEVSDLDGDGHEDLILLGDEQLGLVFGGAHEGTLRERSSFDPPLADTFLDQLAAGDLNGDGVLDLLLSELSENALVIVSTADDDLTRALGFKVFERSALAGQVRVREPRELLCVDIDGDHKQDVVLLVHDKLIVYLQE